MPESNWRTELDLRFALRSVSLSLSLSLFFTPFLLFSFLLSLATIPKTPHHYRPFCPLHRVREKERHTERDSDKFNMGRPRSCFQVITCGGDSKDGDEIDVLEVGILFALISSISTYFLIWCMTVVSISACFLDFVIV